MDGSAIKIVFCDMDDTFLASDKSILEENLKAVDRLRDRGVLFVPCTGRHLEGVPEQVRVRADYVVCNSGASTYDAATGEVVRSCPARKEDVLAMRRAVPNQRIEFDLYCSGKVYVQQDSMWVTDEADLEPAVKEYLSSCRTPYEETFEEFVAAVERIDRFSLMALTAEELSQALLGLKEFKGYKFTPVLPVTVEVTAADASKGAALVSLCEHLGLPISASLALGDSPNDVSMFEVAGISVAVDNAIEECKQLADLVVASCDECGVAQALEQLRLA